MQFVKTIFDLSFIGEVAERLRVSTATVYALCKRGELAHVRVANSIRVGERVLAAFCATA